MAKASVSWSFDRRFEEKIETLVELGVITAKYDFAQHQGKKNFRGTVAQDVLDQALDEIVASLPQELQAKFWRGVRKKETTPIDAFAEEQDAARGPG
jgi:hypothetical protein